VIELFSLAFDRDHRVVLASFRGEFGCGDIATFDAAAEAFVAGEGAVHFLLDFCNVRHVSMPDQAIAERAERPPLCPGFKRVVVAPHPEIFGLYCLFVAKQRRIGADAPIVVRSVQAALDFLGLPMPSFAPVETPAGPAKA
jgi:hypothetical protein